MQHGFMETLADTICLWMPRFGLGVSYTIDAKIQFIIVRFDLAAVLRAPICQDADTDDIYLCACGRVPTLENHRPTGL